MIAFQLCFIACGLRGKGAFLGLFFWGLFSSTGLLGVAPLSADEIRFDSARDWRQWQLPLGAVELTADGRIQPVKVRKDINALLDAPAFGGGIRQAGSNAGTAFQVMDGDPTTGWNPDLEAPSEDWFVEIDLGRAVSARRVRLLFDPDGPPFERFDLLFSAGEQQLDAVGNRLEGTLVYQVQERFKENRDHQITLELDLASHIPIQFIYFVSLLPTVGARLMEVEVEALGDNLALSLLERGGGIDIVLDVDGFRDEVNLGNSQLLVDGNAATAWQINRRIIRGSTNVLSHMTLDLGAVYWTDWVRLIGKIAGGRTMEFDAYELQTSDGSLAPDGTLVWHEQFAGTTSAQVDRNAIADHAFSLVPTRFVRIAWLYWDASCFQATNHWDLCQQWGWTSELQVFGQGYPQAVQLHSPLLDLGTDKNLTALTWQADTPPGTRLEIRSRSGNQVVEHYTFYDKNGKEITERRWNKLIDSFKGPIDTTRVPDTDWSPWSRLYAFAGEAFQSPSPRRFAQLEVRLLSDQPEVAARLDAVALQFSAPLAQQLVGELFPLEVQPGAPTAFRYFVRAGQSRGFDRVVLEASVPMGFEAAFVDGVPVAVQVDTLATGLGITFDRRLGGGQEIEIAFEASVYVQGTRFAGFVEGGTPSARVRQRVEAGDASGQVASSTDVVRLPVRAALLEGLVLSSSVVTPNGDGVHDGLVVGVDVINVLSERPLRVRVYDLSGHRVWEQEAVGVAGHRQVSWDGRTGSGQLLPPGLYVVEVIIEGDVRQTARRKLVALAY